MSQIIWSASITPNENAPLASLVSEYYPQMDALKEMQAIPATDRDITIPNPRAFRSMSRASLLLASVCQGAEDLIKPYLEKDPFSVGVYCAVENGPIHLPTTAAMTDLEEGTFAETYKKLRNPKMYLKQLPNLAPAQMGIFMQIQGPLNVFTHSRAGSLQALDLAEFDLQNDKVEIALVCASFSFEDPLINARIKQDYPDRILAEGAAALLMTKSSDAIDWALKDFDNASINFGIASEVVYLTKEREKHDDKK